MLFLTLLACTGGPSEPVPSDDISPTDTGVDDTDATPGSLRLLSLNLHCLKLDGTAFPTNQARWEAIATRAAAADVQVLALQEVCIQASEEALTDLESALEVATGEPWTSAFALAHTAWEGTPDEAEEGVGLLSRVGLSEPTELAYVSPGELRRVGLVGTLDDGTRVVTVHLDYGDAVAREDQARQTASQSLALASPSLDVLVAGDLNANGGSPTHASFGAMGFREHDATALTDEIDHVFAHRGSRWNAVRTELWWDAGDAVSDHPGVFVTFEAAEPAPVTVTQINASIDVGFGHALSVRGDQAPLSWERGWWAWPVAGDQWRLVLTELDGPFAFKTLVDDTTWQTGDDAAGDAGAENTVSPTF